MTTPESQSDNFAAAILGVGAVLVVLAFGLGRWSAPDYEDSIVTVEAPVPTPTPTPVAVFGPYDWLNQLEVVRVGDLFFVASSDGSYWRCQAEPLGSEPTEAEVIRCVLASRPVPSLNPPAPMVGSP